MAFEPSRVQGTDHLFIRPVAAKGLADVEPIITGRNSKPLKVVDESFKSPQSIHPSSEILLNVDNEAYSGACNSTITTFSTAG